MKNKFYQQFSKIKVGIGGLYCNCCNPYRCNPRKIKMKMRRHARRVLKMNLLKGNKKYE